MHCRELGRIEGRRAERGRLHDSGLQVVEPAELARDAGQHLDAAATDDESQEVAHLRQRIRAQSLFERRKTLVDGNVGVLEGVYNPFVRHRRGNSRQLLEPRLDVAVPLSDLEDRLRVAACR